MILGYAMPVVATITAGGSGAWATAEGGAAALDGKPARRARMTHGWEAPFGTTQFASAILAFDGPQQLRVVGVIGLASVPVGAALALFGRRVGDAGRTYTFGGDNTGTVLRLPGGTLGRWWVLPATADPVTQLEVRIYNDAGGSTWAAPSGVIDIGEIVAMPAVELGIRDTWSTATIDPGEYQLTRGSQRVGAARRTYRTLQAQVSPLSTAETRGGALIGGTDLEAVADALAGNARCVAIPQWRTAGVQDNALIQRTAIYGSATEIPGATNVQGGWFESAFLMDEVPG